MKSKILIALLLSATLFSCDDDDNGPEPTTPVIPNEEEVITTLTYTLTPIAGGDVKVFTFEDLDGDGGDAPIITLDTLEKNTRYSGVVQLLNKQETPAEDITLEVEEEGDEHQFFYQTSNDNFFINYSDVDEDGNPIGIETVLSTASSSSNITITLRHEPNKTAANVSAGDITNAGGETDIEVTFVVDVE